MYFADFPAVLARFIDLYQRDPNGVRFLLENHDPSEWNQRQNIGLQDSEQAMRISNRESRQKVISRTLIGYGDSDMEFSRLLASFDSPELRPPHPELFERSEDSGAERCATFLGITTAEWESITLNRHKEIGKWLIQHPKRDEVDKVAFILGMTRDEFAEFNKAEELRDLGKPDLTIHFARELAVKVGELAQKVERLEELEYKDVLNEEVRSLLIQAHHCYLYGFEVATAILCGAVLEQTLKQVLCQNKELDDLLEIAKQRRLLSPTLLDRGNRVKQARNLAIHNPMEFRRRREDERKSLLEFTRNLVSSLLAPSNR